VKFCHCAGDGTRVIIGEVLELEVVNVGEESFRRSGTFDGQIAWLAQDGRAVEEGLGGGSIDCGGSQGRWTRSLWWHWWRWGRFGHGVRRGKAGVREADVWEAGFDRLRLLVIKE